MDHALIKRLNWEIRWRVAGAGRPLWLGVALLAGAMAIQLLLTLPAGHETEAREGDARRMMAEADRNRLRQPAPVQDDRISAFYRNLPAGAALPVWLGTLSKSAEANGIPFHQGDYRYMLEKDHQFGRYLVDLSLQGGYPSLRAFLAETLNTMPFVGIEELTMSREGIDSESVEVQLRLALYFAGQKAGQP